MASANSVNALRSAYETAVTEMREEFEVTHDGRAVLQRRTALLDSLHVQLWDQYLKKSPGLALVAIGGYGRGAMYPHSDVDLLFLHEGDALPAGAKDEIRRFSQDLWDAHLKLSPATRSLEECERLHADNLEFNISLLDCRYLAGDYELFRRLHEQAIPKFVMRDWQELVRNLTDIHEQRRRKMSDTIFHLEPNVKEAPGGLRDYHLACWLAILNGFERSRMWVNAPEQFPENLKDAATQALDFISTVRCFLHFRAGRDSNTLAWDAQEAAAQAHLGSSPGISAENWMRQYFRHARVLYRLASLMLDEVVPARSTILGQIQNWRSKPSTGHYSSANGRITLQQPSSIVAPDIFFGLFAFMAEQGSRLAGATERKIEQALPSIAARAMTGPQRWQLLSALLRGKFAGVALRSMHELGVLGLLLPEFRDVECLVIRDYYHRYTVDEHTFRAVDVIDGLSREAKSKDQPGERLHELLGEIDRPELLKLSLLLHDLGKAIENQNHIESGMGIATAVCTEFGLSDQESDRVCFLVAYHLEMSQAMRRDIFNPETIKTLGQKVGSHEYLKLLALLTFADISAVNPDAMTKWKSENLWNLYVVTSNYLNRSVDDDRFMGTGGDDQLASVRLLAPKLGSRLKEFLQGLPQRYLRLHSAQALVEHLEMASRLRTEPVQVALKREQGTFHMTVVAQDRPALFATITGALASWGMNIVKADAFSNSAGVVVDSFAFTDRFRTLEMNIQEWDRFRISIADVVTGHVALESLLSGRRKEAARKPKVSIETRITFDDAAALHSTVVEIVAQDRPGLLFRVASQFAALKCNIEVALIDTEGEMVIDVFYLTKSGKKLDQDLESQLRTRLLAELNGN